MFSENIKSPRFWVEAAVIAATYAALTIFLMPFSYGVMQVRISEALTILPVLTPAAIPGLLVGCLLANLLSPYGFFDILLGSLATLLAALGTYRLRRRPNLAPLPPIISNGLIIGVMLHYIYGVPLSLPLCIMWVGLGEALACYGLGWPLLRYLSKRKDLFGANR
ncbi:MAG TPA: QueT transporter family protein [Clostridiales bacterium]|jgi:uncharacterized membrane protein|nr:QueT transporter family protein [Clostridiales bacterium]